MNWDSWTAATLVVLTAVKRTARIFRVVDEEMD